jgi:hypothetical protein
MSVDWERYSTPNLTQERGRKPANEYAVVSLVTEKVRAIPLRVVHSPDWLRQNRAHSDVIGDKKAGSPKARVLLARDCDALWEIS